MGAISLLQDVTLASFATCKNDYRGFFGFQDIQIIAKQLLYAPSTEMTSCVECMVELWRLAIQALNFLHTKMRYTHTDLKSWPELVSF